MKKVALISVVFCLILCTLVSCSSAITEQAFKIGKFSIILDTSFSEANSDYTACYSSPKATVYLLQENMVDKDSNIVLSANLTLAEYAAKVLAANNLSDVSVVEEEGKVYFVYEDATSSRVFRVYLYKGAEAFWCVQFIVDQSSYENIVPEIVKWADSVTVE